MRHIEQRVLVVHTRPGDEAVLSGGLIARSVSDGVQVTVVTATRGETAPVRPDDLAYLRESPDELAAFRSGELAQAMIALGVTDHRFLGGPEARAPGSAPHRYRLGGAIAPDGPPAPDALAAADVERVAADLYAVIQDVRPHAIVTDGSEVVTTLPDAARLRTALHMAWQRCQEETDAWRPLTVFAVERPRSVARRESKLLEARGRVAPERSGALADRRIDAAFDARTVRQVTAEAIACSRSRFAVADGVSIDAAGVARFVPAYVYLSEIGGAARFAPGGVAPDLVDGWEPRAESQESAWFEPETMTQGRRVLEGAILAGLGVLSGAIGTAVHRSTWYPSGTWGLGMGIPVGLPLAAAACIAAVLALRLGTPRRLPAILYALGIFVAVAVFTLPAPGGSSLVVADARGLLWTYGVPIVAVLLSVLRRPQPR